MSKIPSFFSYGLDFHNNFSRIFEEMGYFKNKHTKILHLGAYNGDGTRWMLERVVGSCIDVDTWRGSKSSEGHLDKHDEFYDHNVEDAYDKAVSGLPTTKFKGMTKDFFKQNTETFDFIYIDASHKKEDVAFDLKESWKILNPQGIIACDDYLWNKSASSNMDLIPYEAIKEFLKNSSKEIKILIYNYQVWFKKI